MSESEVPAYFLTPEDAAEELKVPREQVYRWMAGDRIPYIERNGDTPAYEYTLPRHTLLKQFREDAGLANELNKLHKDAGLTN